MPRRVGIRHLCAIATIAGRRRAKQQEQAARGAERNADDRAFAACMEPRGYTVR